MELQDLESKGRQDSKKSVGSKSLEGLSILGRLGLEGLFDIRVLQLIH